MASPHSEPSDDEAPSDQPETLPVIGVGSFGIIHAGSPSIIYKRTIRPHDDANATWSLSDEYDHHVAIDNAFNTWNHQHTTAPLHVRIPHPLRFLDPSNLYAQVWWSTHLGSFGASGAIAPSQSPQPLLQASRIPAVSKFLRLRLIDLYCPVETQPHARVLAVNEDCLLSLYLGTEPTDQGFRSSRHFSLRNFTLDVERMKRLGIDRTWVAREIGRALAVVHWSGRHDGRDVEFVLGGADVMLDEFSEEVVHWGKLPVITASMSTVSSTPSSRPGTRRTSVAFTTPILPVVPSTLKLSAASLTGSSRRLSLIAPPSDAVETKDVQDPGEDGVVSLLGGYRVAIYLLDFNQCRAISADESGVKKCVEAFFLNDPYFPKPPLAAKEADAANGTQGPRAEQEELWTVFESAYLITTIEVVSELADDERSNVKNCSEMFVACVKGRWAEITTEREETREMEREREREMEAAELQVVPQSSNGATVELAKAQNVTTPASLLRDPSMEFGSPRRAIDPAWSFA